MIPKTTPEIIVKALERFDQELRETPDWSGWSRKKTINLLFNIMAGFTP